MDSNRLLGMLNDLPPSKEVLELYRAKVESYEEEEKKLISKLTDHRGLLNRIVEMEGVLGDKDRELRSLQRAVVDLQAAITQEQKRTVKLQAENDQLKIRDSENRRKLTVLLEICGKSDSEITKMIEEADRGRNSNKSSKSEFYIPENVKKYIQDSKKYGKRQRFKRHPESLQIEIATLENHLAEQERCHMEQIATLENERRVKIRDTEALELQYREKIKELSLHLKSMDKVHEDLGNDVIESKKSLHRKERSWIAEKETLLRKLQVLQHFGSIKSDNLPFFTDQRAELRLGGDLRNKKQLQKLNTELAEQKGLANNYKSQILSLEAELDSLRDQNIASSQVFQKRIKAMVERMESMKDHYQDLEERKKKESEGYQTDVKLLKQKIKKIEQDLVKSALIKTKEHEYIRTIKAYERELNELKTSIKNAGVWLN